MQYCQIAKIKVKRGAQLANKGCFQNKQERDLKKQFPRKT
jgi:hypothetical protein